MAIDITTVRPGDVITSDLMKFILGKLSELDTRVAQLEAGGLTSSQVTITGFDPPNQQNAGQVLTVIGKNFAFPPAQNTVFIDDSPVTAFREDSTEQRLRFVVPTSLSIPDAGKNVTVKLSNSTGSAQALYRLLPALAAPGADPVITSVGSADINPIRVNASIKIIGQNFAANPTDNVITFKVVANNATYPKPGQSLTIDTGQTNTTQIVVMVPDITEVTFGTGPHPISLQIGVGAHIPAIQTIEVMRLSP